MDTTSAVVLSVLVLFAIFLAGPDFWAQFFRKIGSWKKGVGDHLEKHLGWSPF